MNNWNNFSDAEAQQDFDVIPKGTLAKVRMTIKPGGFNSQEHCWIGGFATQSEKTGAVYLECEFIILEGQYARRKIWSLIGLHSTRSEKWANMGRSFIKAMLCSSRGIKIDDTSPQATHALSINGFADLDGIEFVAKIGIDKGDDNNDPRNIINIAVTPESKHYASVMGNSTANTHAQTPPIHTPQTGYNAPQPTQQQPPQHMQPHVINQQQNTPKGRPTWAN